MSSARIVRVFLDTNVLVAAFATRGLCADLLRAVLAKHELLSSATVVKELTRTLVEKIRVPEPTVDEIVAFLRSSAVFPDTAAGPPPVAIRDPDDAVILSEAGAARRRSRDGRQGPSRGW